jgi:hypothetical protein
MGQGGWDGSWVCVAETILATQITDNRRALELPFARHDCSPPI